VNSSITDLVGLADSGPELAMPGPTSVTAASAASAPAHWGRRRLMTHIMLEMRPIFRPKAFNTGHNSVTGYAATKTVIAERRHSID
jgi:hypothetical protein